MLTGIVIVLLLLIALLAIPISFTFHVSWRNALQGRLTLRWLFGLVRIRLPSIQSKPAVPDVEALAKPSAGKDTQPLSLLWQSDFRRRMIRFVRDCWHAVQKEEVSLHVRIGLGDPADTGQLWAVVGPAAGVLATVKSASIDIEPDFFDTTLEVDGRGNIRLIPLQVIYLVAALALSPAIWRGIRKMDTAGR